MIDDIKHDICYKDNVPDKIVYQRDGLNWLIRIPLRIIILVQVTMSPQECDFFSNKKNY